jgi:hypothetical protein
MKFTTKNILREMAKQIGVKVKFVGYLPDNIHGKLLPREKRILINANKPRYEHVYTLLHEFAHYLLHFKNRAPGRHCPWYLKINWKIDAIAVFFSKLRRAVRFTFNTKRGKEWEADLWAMGGLVYLKWFFGYSDLKVFLNRHPEKKWIYRYVRTVFVYSESKTRITTTFTLLRKMIHAYRVAYRVAYRD